MAHLSLNGLSVDAINAELRGTEEDKLKKQAANNVIRQREAASLRGVDTGKKSSASSSKPAPPQKSEKADPQKEVKELAECIQKVESFMNHPKLGKRLRGIAIPRNGTLAEYKVCLEQIRNKLGDGLAAKSIRGAYVALMGVALPYFETEAVPESVRLPPRSSDYLSENIRGGAFDDEFEELAIEYAWYFKSGPLPRLLMGTFYSLLQYKKLCEAGVIDLGTGRFKPEFAVFMQGQPPAEPAQHPSYPPSSSGVAESSPPFSAPSEDLVLPRPMKIYEQTPFSSQVTIEPSAPEFGFPSISSRESISKPPSEMQPFEFIEIKSEQVTPAPKKGSRGKGRQL